MNYQNPPPYQQQYPQQYPGNPAPQSGPKIPIMTILGLVVALIGAAGAFGFYFYISHKGAQNMVLFENSLDAKGELLIDGSSKGQLGPHQSVLVTLDSGSHKVTLKGPSGSLDDGSLDVPKKADFGYHALYVIGAKSGVAIVTKFYSNPGTNAAFKDKVDVVPVGTRVAEIPSTSVMKPVDEGFPDTITATKNAMSPGVTRVCHVDAKGKPACPGW